MSSWDGYAEVMDPTCDGCAIVSLEGALCCQHGTFQADADELIEWGQLVQNPALCRQIGLSYGGKKLFVTSYSDKVIIARRDNLVVQLVAGNTVFCASVCDDKPKPKSPKLALEDTKKAMEELVAAGC